jgi:serine/threonine protein kinase
MAQPERVSGLQYSYNSDIWSVGLTLLECSVGHYPYANVKLVSASDCSYLERTAYMLLDQIVEKDAPVAPSDFSPAFADFISKWSGILKFLTLQLDQKPRWPTKRRDFACNRFTNFV